MSEAELQANVAMYLRMQYPNVLFKPDFGSGIKLSPYQARMQKLQSGGRRGWPDIFVAEPAPIYENGNWVNMYHGLFVELKKEGVRLKKKNGEWASDHIKEQAEVLEKLREKGYRAEFAVGFEEATNLIDDYLGGNNG